MTALKSLQATNKALEATQKNISTGFRVSDASDNAAYWSIATTMRSDNKALSTVDDALGLGAAKVDVAYTAMNSAIDVVDEIKTKLVAAREPGVDKSKIQSEIEALQGQLTSIAESASFSGENWLSFNDNTGTSKEVVASFNRDSSGGVTVGTISIDISNIKLFGTDGAGTPANNGLLNTAYTTANGAGTPVNVTYTIATLNITAANVDDTVIDGMVHAVLVQSTIAKGRVTAESMAAIKRLAALASSATIASV